MQRASVTDLWPRTGVCVCVVCQLACFDQVNWFNGPMGRRRSGGILTGPAPAPLTPLLGRQKRQLQFHRLAVVC